MWGSETLAMLVSSTSMKVESMTTMEISQGLIAGVAAGRRAVPAASAVTALMMGSSHSGAAR